ncbi:MAG: DUF6115 domain-containing protein [Spirochaetia bacterium]
MQQYIVFTIINIGVLAIMFLYFRNMISKKSDPEAILTQFRSEIQQLITEMNQTADMNIGLIEDRIQNLNALLEKADKRISILSKESEKQEFSAKVYSNILKKQKKQEDVETKPQEKAKSVPASVHQLYNQGFSPEVIAKKLKTTVGEVELIISLGEPRN